MFNDTTLTPDMEAALMSLRGFAWKRVSKRPMEYWQLHDLGLVEMGRHSKHYNITRLTPEGAAMQKKLKERDCA